MNTIPSREKNKLFVPKCFEPYRNTRIVLDCTEIECDIPKNMEKQKIMFSGYKGRTTFKYEVGCANNGAVTYCSPGYPGSTSDKSIIQHSGILNHLIAGDLILADKGFLIADIIPQGVSLNIPSFLANPKFTDNEIVQSRKNSRARVHIERVNERLKRFLIIKHISHKLFASCDILVQLCCALINLQNPILGECQEFFKSC